MRKLLIIAAASLPFPAMAERGFERPEQCEKVVVALYSNCELTVVLKCTDASGEYRRKEEYNADGPTGVEIESIDFHLESIRDRDGIGDVVFAPEGNQITHPRDILATGHGTQSAQGIVKLFGLTRDVSIGAIFTSEEKTIEIDGLKFSTIEHHSFINFPAPVGQVSVDGTYIYDPQRDVLLDYEVSASKPNMIEAYRLMELAYPGDSAFDFLTPAYGCGELSKLSFEPMAEQS